MRSISAICKAPHFTTISLHAHCQLLCCLAPKIFVDAANGTVFVMLHGTCMQTLQVGTVAINDGILLESCMYRILKKHFKSTPYYTELLDLFHEVSGAPEVLTCQ